MLKMLPEVDFMKNALIVLIGIKPTLKNIGIIFVSKYIVYNYPKKHNECAKTLSDKI